MFIQVITLIMSMVVARMLTPEEVGIYAISSALAMILAEFKILGAGAYLIREKFICSEKIKSALGLTIIMSFGLGFFIIVSANYVSSFYGIDDSRYLLWIISLTFFISPYTSIPYALLTRDMDFSSQRKIKIWSSILNLFSTVIFILNGFSYYSIALGYLAAMICQFVLINFIFQSKMMEYVPSFRNMGPIFRLGIMTSIGSLLNRSNTLLPDIVIGKLGTPVQVGIFSRGLGFVQFISHTLGNGISAVSFSYLSSVRRNGGNLENAYVKSSTLFNSIATPTLLVAALLSLPAIRLLFGNQWDEAAEIASYLMIWAALRAFHYQFSGLLITLGRTSFLLAREVLCFTLIISSCFFLYDLGIKYIAIGFMASALFEFIFLTLLLKYLINLSVIDFLKGVFLNLTLGALCAAPVLVFKSVFNLEDFSELLIAALVFLYLPFAIFLFVTITKHPMKESLDFLKLKIFK
ncbi:hypothetical protein AEST_30380 [Alishewanella aestuarii B11]|uniref:Polysaccharide biosynthesis protein n=2 Tax=Alishewanella aestuarii TaxID=453835 RepID=J2IC08_9ALTE|nr:hypothetical protein AEST_30380 [Alishewanella aestuarii B11]